MSSRYPNLYEVRLIPTKKDIAFVEYLDEASATVAKDALHNYKLDGENKIKVPLVCPFGKVLTDWCRFADYFREEVMDTLFLSCTALFISTALWVYQYIVFVYLFIVARREDTLCSHESLAYDATRARATADHPCLHTTFVFSQAPDPCQPNSRTRHPALARLFPTVAPYPAIALARAMSKKEDEPVEEPQVEEDEGEESDEYEVEVMARSSVDLRADCSLSLSTLEYLQRCSLYTFILDCPSLPVRLHAGMSLSPL